MISAQITRESPVVNTARVMQMTALFDVPPAEKSKVSWDVNIPIDEREWNVGLIVGPSGSGKTTVAREIFPNIVSGFDWPGDKSILDGFPQEMGIHEVTRALSSVGFGSAPNWLRPFRVLSNGEQFRATVARALAEATDEPVVIDEFTSVVDRQVAKIASHSVQKAVRKGGKKLVAVACHYDIIDWLQPDWVYEPHVGSFDWRSLRRRPEVPIEIRSVGKDLWPLFSRYHYLSGSLHTAAKCIAAFLDDRPIAFSAVRKLQHRVSDIMLGHRLVVHPDYQGLGIGGRLDDWLGLYLWDRGWRYHNVIAHPAMRAYYSASPRWKLISAGRAKGGGTNKSIVSMYEHQMMFSAQRNASSFAYTAPAGSQQRLRGTKPLEL